MTQILNEMIKWQFQFTIAASEVPPCLQSFPCQFFKQSTQAMLHCSISTTLGMDFSNSCTCIPTCTDPLPFNSTNSSLNVPLYRTASLTRNLWYRDDVKQLIETLPYLSSLSKQVIGNVFSFHDFFLYVLERYCFSL